MTDDHQDELHRRHAAIQTPTTSELELLRAQNWNAWLRGHLDIERATIEKEIAAERMQRHALRDALGEVIGGERRRFKALVRDEIAALKAELLGEINKLHGDLADRKGEVIDLPALPSLRGRRDAAA